MDGHYKAFLFALATFCTNFQFLTGQDEGYFWHVTDMHLDPTYDTASPAGSCGAPPDGQDSWGEFGDYLCDSPWILINSSVYAMREIHSDVDFLIWTGDDTPHIYNDTLLDKDAVYKIISNLTDLLQEVFPDKLVYSALGNHDWSPKSFLPPKPDPFYEKIAAKWSDWLYEPQAKETFNKGGYYTLPIEDTSIDAVILNTNLYYTSNGEVNGTGDPAGQFEWLDDLLTNITAAGRKAMIITHIPPGMFEKHRSKYWYYPEYNVNLHNLLVKHANVIGSMHAAHHHTDSFRVLYNENRDAVSSMLLAPAVTPWETTLEGVIGGAANNPGIRLIKYDKMTGVVLDVEQYFLNLTQANLNGYPEWIPEYKATAYYGQPDMGTTSLDSIAQDLLTDDDLFKKYYVANGVNYDPDEVCEGECRFIHYCAITEVDYDAFEGCVDALLSSSPSLQKNLICTLSWALVLLVLNTVIC